MGKEEGQGMKPEMVIGALAGLGVAIVIGALYPSLGRVGGFGLGMALTAIGIIIGSKI